MSTASVFKFLNTKTFSDQFGTKPFPKMYFYFDILTISPILKLGSLLLISLLELKCMCLILYQQVSFKLFCDMSCCVY